MAHAPGRSTLPPFTRRGPPTEDEERKALEERRTASRQRRAQELPPARSIPRTPHDPSAPTINPPGVAPGPSGPAVGRELREQNREQRRILRDQRLKQRQEEQEQGRIDRNKRLREAGRPEEELPSERRARGEAIRRDRVRRAAERRDELGLAPREDRGASIKAEAARIAALSGDLSPIPRVRGSLEDLASRARVNPSLLEPNEIVRATVDGQETLQRFNAQSGTFTRMRIDPVTGDFVVDLTTPESLSDADLAEAVGDIRSNIEGLLKDATPDETKDLNSILSLLDAAEEFPFTPAQFANFALGLTDRVNRITKEKPPKVPAIEDVVGENVMKVKGFEDWFWVRNEKTGALDLKQVKVEPEEAPAPTTPQQLFAQGDAKEQRTTIFNIRKEAVARVDAVHKQEAEDRVAKAEAKAKFAFEKTVAGEKDKNKKKELIAAGMPPVEVDDTPDPITEEEITAEMKTIAQGLIDLTTPPTPPPEGTTAPTPTASAGFKGGNIAAVAKELGMSVEEARARLRNLVPP